MNRAARLSENVPKACDQFSKEAWGMLISSYLSPVLALAEQVLPDEDPKEEPDTFFFKVFLGILSRFFRLGRIVWPGFVRGRFYFEFSFQMRKKEPNQ